MDPDNPARFPKWTAMLGEFNPAMWRLKYSLMTAAEIEAALAS